MNDATVVVAGATGNLGGHIARALRERGVSVRALVRHGTTDDKLERLRKRGVTIVSVDFSNASLVAPAFSGASCVVSALAGLREVMVGIQTLLLDAAIKDGVPRFIPSDYSIDYTKLPAGENRSTAGQSCNRSIMIVTLMFVGQLCGMCSQNLESRPGIRRDRRY